MVACFYYNVKWKNGKSQGNILKIKDFKNITSGQVLRLVWWVHYRQPLDWNDKLLEDLYTIEWYNVYLNIDTDQSFWWNYQATDDLNNGYIANLHQLYERHKRSDEDKNCYLHVILLDYWMKQKMSFKFKKDVDFENEILNKIDQRNKARVNKNYDEADKIRDELLIKVF